jgi:RND family efflux transporter MFP subunit
MRLIKVVATVILTGSVLGIGPCSTVPEVASVHVARATVEQTVTSVNAGTVKAEHSAELAFGIVGRVKAVNVKAGDFVKGGAILAEVENVDLSDARAAAIRELERKLNIPGRAVSASEVDQARQAVENARMVYEKSLIRAPYDGTIVELNLDVGQLSQITAINPKAMIRIVDSEPRYIRAEIDEADLSTVRLGQPGRVRIMALGKEWLPGKVRKIIPFVSAAREQERTVEIELTIEGTSQNIPAGASADVEIVVATHRDVLAVSSRAILGRSGERYAFRIENGILHKVPVTTGLFNYEVTELAEGSVGGELAGGLKEGEQVCLPHEIVDFKEGQQVKVISGESVR